MYESLYKNSKVYRHSYFMKSKPVLTKKKKREKKNCVVHKNKIPLKVIMLQNNKTHQVSTL